MRDLGFLICTEVRFVLIGVGIILGFLLLYRIRIEVGVINYYYWLRNIDLIENGLKI
jgi:hypothetical protein